MKILSIDTATMMSSIAIMEDSKILGSLQINQERTHSETLLPMIDVLLENLSLKISDIDLIAIGKGPGSFTGLRIGMTVAKTMAQVMGIKIIGLSTLKSMCIPVLSNRRIIPLLDARGGRVYYGIYQWKDGKLKTLQNDDLMNIEDLIKGLDNDDYLFIGDCAKKYEEMLKKHGEISNESINHNFGSNLCVLADLEYEQGCENNLYTLTPEYIRKSQAQRDLEKKLGHKND